MTAEIVRELIDGQWVTTLGQSGGGGGTPTLAQVLAQGNDAGGSTIENLAAGVNPTDGANVSQAGGGTQDLASVLAEGGDPDGNPITGAVTVSIEDDSQQSLTILGEGAAQGLAYGVGAGLTVQGNSGITSLAYNATSGRLTAGELFTDWLTAGETTLHGYSAANVFDGPVQAEGFDAHSNKITGVDPGTDPTDAANVSQVGGWPVRETIFAYLHPKANTDYDNVNTSNFSNVQPFGTRYSDNTDGAWVEWYVSLMAGTYSIHFRGISYDGSGILVFSLNGTDITAAPYNASNATVDTYSASPNDFFESEIASDLIIPASGVYVLRATVTGHNVSSSGFATNFVALALDRIAA